MLPRLILSIHGSGFLLTFHNRSKRGVQQIMCVLALGGSKWLTDNNPLISYFYSPASSLPQHSGKSVLYFFFYH